MQAVMHILSLAGLDFRVSERRLRPPDLRNGEIRLTDASLGPMLWHTETGAAQWDAVLPEDLQELRLVLAPDEGGPLWAGFQWLAKAGYRISFLPDLMYLGFCSVPCIQTQSVARFGRPCHDILVVSLHYNCLKAQAPEQLSSTAEVHAVREKKLACNQPC